MNTAINTNVVHEAEAQRQYARVKLPARIRFQGAHREGIEQPLQDLSAGGFSFISKSLTAKTGDHLSGKLMFAIDSLSFAIDVAFQIKTIDRDTGRVGCEFHDLGTREVSTLRYLITAYLSGEVVSVGDMLNTLQRDNFTKGRKKKGATGHRNGMARLGAVGGSLALFVVGLAAFGFVAKSVYDFYFVTHADSAVVSVPVYQIAMPREGTVNALVKPGDNVANGAPIGSFSATMLEMLKGNLDNQQITPAKVEELFGRQLKGTLTSPCDCRVVQQLVGNGQYANKGDPIFTLAANDAPATIQATFPYRAFNDIHQGGAVNFTISGDSTVRTGKIVNTSLPTDMGRVASIVATIQPDQKIEASMAGRPVEVTLSGNSPSNWVGNTLANIKH